MADGKSTIRNRLLLFGVIATATVWGVAAQHCVGMFDVWRNLDETRRHLELVNRYSEVGRLLSLERAISAGQLTAFDVSRTGPLEQIRSTLDRRLALLESGLSGEDRMHDTSIEFFGRVAELKSWRERIGMREARVEEVFHFFGEFIKASDDSMTQHLAHGMIAMRMQYEFAIHLKRAASMLSQIRGVIYLALKSGEPEPQDRETLYRLLLFYDDSLRNFDHMANGATKSEAVATIYSPEVQKTIVIARQMLESADPAVAGLQADAWWAGSTAAVEKMDRASLLESSRLLAHAESRINQVWQQIVVVVTVLFAIGLMLMLFAIAAVRRVTNGLTFVMRDLAKVKENNDFSVRLEGDKKDEIGVIADGINHLIQTAGNIVHFHEMQSLCDPLTGVMNRRGFDAQLAARMIRARSNAPVFSLIMIDVDHFKEINDGCGHPAGDRVLRILAILLRDSLRPDDVLARFGGEEFVAILPGCALPDALMVAKKLQAAVRNGDYGIGRRVTASFGVAQWQLNGSPQELIKAADEQLYKAKHAGRDRVMPLPGPQEISTAGLEPGPVLAAA
ncbi:MAG: diguanylate cyclase [Burkholderiales bacterium]